MNLRLFSGVIFLLPLSLWAQPETLEADLDQDGQMEQITFSGIDPSDPGKFLFQQVEILHASGAADRISLPSHSYWMRTQSLQTVADRSFGQKLFLIHHEDQVFLWLIRSGVQTPSHLGPISDIYRYEPGNIQRVYQGFLRSPKFTLYKGRRLLTGIAAVSPWTTALPQDITASVFFPGVALDLSQSCQLDSQWVSRQTNEFHVISPQTDPYAAKVVRFPAEISPAGWLVSVSTIEYWQSNPWAWAADLPISARYWESLSDEELRSAQKALARLNRARHPRLDPLLQTIDRTLSHRTWKSGIWHLQAD
ncbi:hypothetical protein [Pontibacter sp. G13]|uniref:hypothetical protein n=1 Tax=Pontibacter sp. G13 TaxID=3074898 RepID=UPI00288B3A1F|nr:hypothetical protein [Pontibacter sp. G13]WNJ19374.1 hypothetical protein RJD25_02680 [Pontibacter sp. G13]